MPTLQFTTRGNAETLRAQEQQNAKARELKAIYEDDARAARQLEAATTRIFRNTKQPAEQFNREMGALLGRFNQGKISADQYRRGVDRLEGAYQKANTLGGKLQGTVSNLFGPKAIQQLLAFGGGVASISTAIRLLTAEYQAQVDLVNKAAQTQLSVGASRNIVIRNLAGQSQEVIDRVLLQNEALARQVGVSETAINAGRAEALSASGGNISASLSATRVAAQFLADRPSEIGGFAGSLLDLSKVTGTEDARVNLGLLTQVAALSRVTSPQQQAQNIPRALIGARSFGATSSESAAIFAALTTASGDITGARSGTATIQLTKQLSEFLTDDDTSKKIDTSRKKQATAAESLANAEERLSRAKEEESQRDTSAERRVADAEARAELLGISGTPQQKKSSRLQVERARTDLARDRSRRTTAREDAERKLIKAQKAFDEASAAVRSAEGLAGTRESLRQRFSSLTAGQQIAFLQDNPDLANQFLDTTSFEAVAKGPIRDLLLNRNSPVSRQLRANLTAIPDNQGLSRLAGQTLESFSANRLRPVDVASRTLAGLAEQLEVGATKNLGAEQREDLQTILQRVGNANLSTRVRTFFAQLQDGEVGVSIEESADLLDREAKRLRSPKTRVASAGVGAPGIVDERPASKAELQNAEILQSVAEILREQLKQQEETNRKLSEGGLVVGAN